MCVLSYYEGGRGSMKFPCFASAISISYGLLSEDFSSSIAICSSFSRCMARSSYLISNQGESNFIKAWPYSFYPTWRFGVHVCVGVSIGILCKHKEWIESKIFKAATIYQKNSKNLRTSVLVIRNHTKIGKNLQNLLGNMAPGKRKVYFPELIFLQMARTQYIS